MPLRRGNQRPTLSQGLDKEVYQVVRKLFEEQLQLGDYSPSRLTVSCVYEKIKKSNSSLNRKSKKLLEDSIDRVISVIKEENADDSAASMDGDYDGLEEDTPAHELNVMNKSIIGMWCTKKSSGAATPKRGTPLPQGSELDRPSGLPLQSITTNGSSSALSKKRDRQTTGEPLSKRRKGETKDERTPPSNITLADLGGVDSVIHDLTELIALPMLYPEVYTSSGIQPPRGVLLHGPPGCGKTMIANAFAAELGVSFIPISAPSIVSGMSGESEKKLRELFDEATKMAPCLMFIDEIDAITPKRESAQREMEKRIVAQMLTCMDDLSMEKTNGKPVIIIAATNRPDSLDPALRRAGRFNKEINLSVPDEAAREKILRALTQKLRLSNDIDFHILSRATPGFVGADLSDLVSTAGVAATKRIFEILRKQVQEDSSAPIMTVDDPNSTTTTYPISPDLATLRAMIHHSATPLPSESLTTLTLTSLDFLTALPKIQPSSKREGFATIPSTTWSDIGALASIRSELQMAIVGPIAHPERYAAVGITSPTGILLWGPPGCGKTLLAKAVANESRANFISVKGPELLNKYVGESERAVRQVFVRARSSVPCVVFFDELDALVPRRDDGGSGSEASARVVNTLLTELDGLGSERKGIYVVAATNRPDIIDPAMLRPGRLGHLLFVDLPEPSERVEILKTLVKVRAEADLDGIARMADGFSGADLESLVRAAGIAALRRGGDVLLQVDFEEALRKVERSVRDPERYRRLKGRSSWG